MAVLVNRAKMTTSTTGTGTITLGSAVQGYQSFADAGVLDGENVRYVIEDGSNWELGTGIYTASGTTLTRNVSESSNAGSAINLSGAASVFVAAAAADIFSKAYTKSTFTATGGQTDFSVTYDVGYVDVWLNGTKLGTADYTATNGTTVVLASGATAGDLVEIVAWTTVPLTSLAGSYTETEFTATGGQTDFSVTYQVGFVDVWLNGVKLATSDFTATDGSTVVLSTGATAGDLVQVIAWGTISVLNGLTSSDIGVTVQAYDPNLATTGKAIAMAIVFGG